MFDAASRVKDPGLRACIEIRHMYFREGEPLLPLEELKDKIIAEFEHLTIVELGMIFLMVEKEYERRCVTT